MLTVFDFKGNQVRFVNGLPVANDVAQILGYASPKDAVYRHVDNDYKGGAILATPGGNQEVIVLKEAGVYQLIFRSKLEIAKEFQKWVFEEVLPSIRKTGSYSVQTSIPLLSTHEVALQKARVIAEIEALLPHQPRLAQFLIDHSISELMEQKALTGAVLKGVVEIAKELGLPVNINNRSPLGRFVKSQVGHLAVSEKRLVNGKMKELACYPDVEEVKNAVKLFFTK